MRVAIAHDYLTQRGGAERVVMEMARAFPGAPLHTTLYDPAATYSGFGLMDVRPGVLDRVGLLRRHHRLALPLLAAAVSRTRIDADVVLCSSSGWAHGVATTGRKVVYCYTPARWLYQAARYLDGGSLIQRAGLTVLAPWLRRWDRAAAASADVYLAVSTVVRDRIRETYDRDAEVVFPPVLVDVDGAATPVPGLEPGFALCVSRLLGYKNVAAVVAAGAAAPEVRFIVAGDGPLLERLREDAPGNVNVLGRVTEAELRWLYRNAALCVTASYEDFGLVPIEAAAFGVPTAALRWGGHLDTVVDGETGVFFARPEPAAVADAVRGALAASWRPEVLRGHAAGFAPERFRSRLRELVLGTVAASF